MILYSDADFKRRMRADRPTFFKLVDALRPRMEKQTTNFKRPVPVEKRVAAALYHYGHGGSLEDIADQFDVSLALMHEILHEFTDAVIDILGNELSWPSDARRQQYVIDGFYNKQLLPNCCGAIDCSHILVTTPDGEAPRPYVDRGGHKSTILQAVVDGQGRFLDVFAGWPGSVHDQRVFHHSPIYEHITRHGLLDGPTTMVQGKEIGPWLAGDAGYKLEPWMIIPFPGLHLNQAKQDFNFKQSSTRIIVEQAFGRLKGRFRWLNGVLYLAKSSRHCDVIVAACILHNFMISMNDVYDVTWREGVNLRVARSTLRSNGKNLAGSDVRDVLLCKSIADGPGKRAS